MKPFFTLLGVSFKSILLNSSGSGGRRGKRKKVVSGIGALLLLCFLMVYISATFSFMLAETVAPAGGLDVMLMMMSIMACAYPFIFTLYAAQGQVFSTKDVDLVLSLPVSSFTIMISRVLALYLEALLMVEMMLIPAGVAYLYHGGAGGAGFMILLVIAGIFLALIPTLGSMIFGTVITILISRIKRFKNLFNIIFSLLLMVVVFVAVFSFSFMSGGGMDLDIVGLRGTLTNSLPPIVWAVSAMMGNVMNLLLLIVCTVLPFLLLVWLFSLFYKPLLTSLTSNYSRNDYKLRGVKASGQFAALFKKEIGKFFGTPAYVLNSGIGLLMLLIASVAAVIFRSFINDILATMSANGAGEILDKWLPLVLLGVVCFFGSMVYISCVSISLEGKTLWILKEAPIGTGRIFMAKAGTNFIIDAVPFLICIPLLGYAFSINIPVILLMIMIGLLFSLFGSTAGLFINLMLPRMDAENDTMVIKQSASVIVTMVVQWVLVAGIVLLFVAMQSLGFVVYALTMCAILLVLDIIVIALLNTKGRKLFATL